MTTCRIVAIACLVNVSMGVLYVWSLFLLPLEARLGLTRADLSLVSSCSLVLFTLGMVLHGRFLSLLSARLYVTVSYCLVGAGHLVFGLFPSFGTLLLGYGLMFGLGSGLGYGLALALVTNIPEDRRSAAIGIVMAAFAVSGVVLSGVFSGIIGRADPASSFSAIGLTMFAIGLFVVLSLPGKLTFGSYLPSGIVVNRQNEIFEARFLFLFAAFFFICFIGLMMVAHATGIFAAAKLDSFLVGLAPGVFTAGYVLGSLFGGKLVEQAAGAGALAVANGIASAGLIILFTPASSAYLLSPFAIGLVFGGSASLMPTLVAEVYGPQRVSDIYGKLMAAYGVAGLLSPWLSGALYSVASGYEVALTLSLCMSLSGIGLAFFMRHYLSRA